MKQKILFLFIYLLAINYTNAQVSVNTTGAIADPSAMLDISSTNKGILIPRMTTSQRNAISTPAIGLMVFDNTTGSFWFNNSNGWGEITVNSSLSDADNDTKILVDKESNDDDQIHFELGGTEYFMMKPGGRMEVLNNGNSVFLGKGAGNQDDLTDNRNTYIGGYAGELNTTGTNNVALGYYALRDNISGGSNTAIGPYALQKNKSDSNTAIGSLSLYNNNSGSSNVGIGSQAGLFNQGGVGNVMIGVGAGAGNANHNKNNNVMVGHGAGFINEGDGNVFLGYKAGYNESGSNKLYIDNSNTSSPLIYGDFSNNLIKINGTLTVGSSGSAITSIIKKTVNVNLPNIGSNNQYDLNIGVSGAVTGSSVFVSPGADLPGSLLIGHCYVSSTGVVTVRILNEGSNGQNANAMDYYITVIK